MPCRPSRPGRNRKELRPDRDAGHLGMAQMPCGFGKVDGGGGQEAPHQAVRHAGYGIRLESKRGNAQQDRSHHGRAAGVATDTHHHLRPECSQQAHTSLHAAG